MRVFVTGGAGSIGSEVIRYHLENGDSVWAVDNMQSGQMNNLVPFQSRDGFRFDQADIRNWDSLEEAVQNADKIYHLAATVGQRLVLANPVQTLANNIDGCNVVLEAMAKNKSKARFLLASTSELYFNSEVTEEGTDPETALMSFESGKFLQETYPLSKLVNETAVLSYVHKNNLQCTIARLFNTVGINQISTYGMVVPTFIAQGLSGKPITVFGDGLQTRSFANVHDSARALDLLLENPKCIGEIVNVGSDQECSILDLAKLIQAKTGNKSEITFLSYLDAYGVDFHDVRKRKPDLKKLRHLTGFQPKWTLEKTVDEMIAKKKALV